MQKNIELKYAMVNVDALCYHLVRNLCAGVPLSNLGDIISDSAGPAGGLDAAGET